MLHLYGQMIAPWMFLTWFPKALRRSWRRVASFGRCRTAEVSTASASFRRRKVVVAKGGHLKIEHPLDLHTQKNGHKNLSVLEWNLSQIVKHFGFFHELLLSMSPLTCQLHCWSFWEESRVLISSYRFSALKAWPILRMASKAVGKFSYRKAMESFWAIGWTLPWNTRENRCLYMYMYMYMYIFIYTYIIQYILYVYKHPGNSCRQCFFPFAALCGMAISIQLRCGSHWKHLHG